MELASGLHWYLKYSCGAHISWDKTGGIQIASIPEPDSLPFVRDEGLVFKRPVPWNYYQNVVTSSCEYYQWLSFCGRLIKLSTFIFLYCCLCAGVLKQELRMLVHLLYFMIMTILSYDTS